MVMGICSDEDFEKELANLSVIVDGVEKSLSVGITGEGNVTGEILNINRGRGNGNNEVPESLKKIIGETSIEEGRKESLQIARAFGISDSSVSAYSVGSTSTASYRNPARNLQSHLNRAKERIQKKARVRLSNALDSITPEKLADANLREASGVARDMSVIIKNLEPESERSPLDTPQFIIYAPSIRKEESFEVINVQE